MTEARFLTHAQRAKRRGVIKRRLKDRQPVTEIAAEFGLTIRYVRQIAQDNGLAQSVGRPRGTRWWAECPPHLIDEYDYLTRRKRIPVAQIKAMLESAA